MSDLFRRFIAGFFVPLTGLSLISANRRVRRLAVTPFLLTLVIIVGGVGLGLPYCSDFVHLLIRWSTEQTAHYFPSGSTVVRILIEVVTWPVAFVFLVVTLFAISRIVALPFFTLLAERALTETKIRRERPFQFQTWLMVSLRLMGIAIVKLAGFAICGIILFFFSLIPGFGLFSMVGFLVLAAIDVVDISFDALEMTLSDRVRFVRREFASILGLATSLGLVFFIPGLNFFLFPAAIAGCHVILRGRTFDSNSGKNEDVRIQ